MPAIRIRLNVVRIAGMARSYIYLDKGQLRWFSLRQV